MRSPLHATAILGAYVLLATPPMRSWMESSMVGHMLVQIPLLIAIGALAVAVLPRRLLAWLQLCNGRGIPLTLLALFALSYWMLPRALDAALNSPLMEFTKFVSLPLLVGVPLALSWRRLSLIGQGFVWSNFVSMLGVLAWLYLVAPVRVCNNYLVDQQALLGKGLFALALALFVLGVAHAFFGGAARQRCHASSTVAHS